MNDRDDQLDDQIIEPVGYDFGWSRRSFMQVLGAGVVISVTAVPALAQQRRGREARKPLPLGARLHIGADGVVTVMTGKVEGGQGSRAQITQAAAEELGIPADQVRLIMADTALCPDDGITAGSRTTPSTLPAVRQGCAAARAMRASLSKERGSEASYADLAAVDALTETVPGDDVEVEKVSQWEVLGTPLPRPNGRDLVTGRHAFPADVIRPGMLYGKILRPPSYGAKLESIDLAPAQAMDGVVVVSDEGLVGVAAPTRHAAKRAIATLSEHAKWQPAPHPASDTLFDHLRDNAEGGRPTNPLAEEARSAKKSLAAKYDVAYVQHAPMEPRAAVAEWEGEKLTVWTSTQNPFGVRRELAGAFHIPEQRVRVIVPDFGGGFGGKHTGETAVEAARLARSAGKPVAVRWSRAEEFTWAAFRPAAAIDIEAGLDDDGKLSSWHFVNINSGRSGIETPYRAQKKNIQHLQTAAPLRHGSYRALAATANHFARESFMDELAALLGKDPLAYRLELLEEPRMRAVLEDVAERGGWKGWHLAQHPPGEGIGLACGTDKGSFVAACAVVSVDEKGTIDVRRVWQSYECGKITSPHNLMTQVQGAIVMGLGPALREAMQFADGKIRNASFWEYEVPRLKDLPQLDVHLLDRPDLPSVGAGETPLIAIAPAIGNAVFRATGKRLRQMPMRLEPA